MVVPADTVGTITSAPLGAGDKNGVYFTTTMSALSIIIQRILFLTIKALPVLAREVVIITVIMILNLNLSTHKPFHGALKMTGPVSIPSIC